MIKVKVIEQFTLKKFKELKNIERANKEHEDKKYDGELFVNDIFECNEEMVKYLTGDNALRKIVVKVIEVEPEKKEEKELIYCGDKQTPPQYEEVIKPKKKKSSKK